MLWDMPEWSRMAERFPVGTYVRVTDRETLRAGIGRVTATNGRMVTVRFTGTDTHTFDADWLLPVRYVSSRYHGPRMSTNGRDTVGARIVVNGRRGDRYSLTVPFDPATSGGMSGDGAHESAVTEYARERLGMCAPVVEWLSTRNGARVYAITDTGTCECDDEYGPCEFHAETLVTREGASMRTADELSHEFLTDVVSVCGEWPSAEFESETIRLGNALADNRSDWGSAWLPDSDDGEDLPDTLQDLVRTAESFLADHGYTAVWQDGYRIIRVTGGPWKG